MRGIIMPDNFARMTSSEAPEKLQDFCFPNRKKQESSWGKAFFEGMERPSVPYRRRENKKTYEVKGEHNAKNDQK